MKTSFVYLFPALLVLWNVSLRADETITVDGRSIPNCKIVEISHDGPIYLCTDSGEHHVVPWEHLSAVQQNSIRENHQQGLVNAICGARYIDGTVFHANQDGVIIQVSIQEKGSLGIAGYHKGAKVMKSGLVQISGLPLYVPRSAGDSINLIVYFRAKTKFDMGLGSIDMEQLTVEKPSWYRFAEWKNLEGKSMEARLIGIKDDKVLFEKKDSKRFVYPISQLDSDSQKRAKEINQKLSGYPVS